MNDNGAENIENAMFAALFFLRKNAQKNIVVFVQIDTNKTIDIFVGT